VHHPDLVGSVVALVVWTLIVQAWMLSTRLRALRSAGISLKNRRGGSSRNALEGILPNRVSWKAHNYANLMEQPTVFYAVVFALVALGSQSNLSSWFAWLYVASRIVHSLIQATVNIVTYRLAAFTVGSLCVSALAAQAFIQLVRV
jgi:hypothetical protein